MHAAIIDSENHQIKIREISAPELSADHVLIQLKAAGLNHRDLWIQKGSYKNIHYPCQLGSDGAGIVVSTGVEVNNHWLDKPVLINPSLNWGPRRQGQGKNFEILGMPSKGTFAEFISVPVENVYPLPGHLSFVQAAALPLGGLTAYRALFYRGQARKGQSVLITGIGGGVATLLMQFAVAAGLRVYVTSSSDSKIETALSMKATAGANYTIPTWKETILEAEPEGFDLIIDSAAGNSFPVLLELIKTGGTIVNFGGTDGKIPGLIPQRLFWKQANILGTTMGSAEDFSQMLDFVSENRIIPVIDKQFKFEQIESAFNYLADQTQFGKIVINFGDDV